jgi:hypothetical protein
MQQKPTRKLNSQFAIDFHLPAEMPVNSSVDRAFGRGYTIAAFICFCLFVGSFVNLYFSLNDNVKLVRGIGYLLIVTGGSFTFAILYQTLKGIGIPWGVDFFGRYASSGVLDPRRSPLRFWLVGGGSLLFFMLFIGGGIWLCLHAARIASAMH